MTRNFLRRCTHWFLAGAVGCGDTTAPAPCSGRIEVSVRTATQGVLGASPRFYWAPACGVAHLVVSTIESDPLDERAVWGLSVPEVEPFGPSVAYGFGPRRAQVWAGPEPLESGRMYEVTVTMTVGEDVLLAIGTTSFVAP